MQNLSYDNEFHLHGKKKNDFLISGFTRSLALKQRLEASQKWPTITTYYGLLLMSLVPLIVSICFRKRKDRRLLADHERLRACLRGGGGPQVGEVTRFGGVNRLSV